MNNSSFITECFHIVLSLFISYSVIFWSQRTNEGSCCFYLFPALNWPQGAEKIKQKA